MYNHKNKKIVNNLPRPYSFIKMRKDITTIRKIVQENKEKQKQRASILKKITDFKKEEILEGFRKSISQGKHIEELLSLGLSAEYLEYKKISLRELINASRNSKGIPQISIKDLKKLKYSLNDLKKYYSLKELKEYYSLKELKEHYTFKELRKVFSIEELLSVYSVSELKKIYTDLNKVYSLIDELIKIFPLSILVEVFPLSELKKYFSLKELKEYYSLEKLFKEYSLEDLSNEFSFNELKDIILKNIEYKELRKIYSARFLKKKLCAKELLNAYSLKELKKDFALEYLIDELLLRKKSYNEIFEAGYSRVEIMKAAKKAS